MTSDGRVMQLL